MENPHEEKQAVLLERIIKNVVSRQELIRWRVRSSHLAGEVQRKHRRAQPVPRGNPTIQRGLHYIGLVPELLAKCRVQSRGYQEPGGPKVNGRWRETQSGDDVDER